MSCLVPAFIVSNKNNSVSSPTGHREVRTNRSSHPSFISSILIVPLG